MIVFDEVLIYENFHPGYRDLGRRNRLLISTHRIFYNGTRSQARSRSTNRDHMKRPLASKDDMQACVYVISRKNQREDIK